MKKNIFKYGIAFGLFVILLLSVIKFNNTKYTYLDVFKLKGSSLIREIIYDGTFPLRSDDPNKVKKLIAPSIELLYKKKTVKYFDELWAGYEKGSNTVSYTKEGIAYYKKKRAWKKAKLVFAGDTMEVKIRSHGIEPDGHHLGDYFSYQVKTKKGEFFKGQSKFKLLIFERLGFHVNLLSFYHKKYNLLWAKPEELVKVKVNNGQEKLFYIEKYGASLHKELSNIKRLAINDYKSGAEILDKPSPWVVEAVIISKNDSIEKSDLLRFNSMLLTRDSIGIHQFFDEDYLIRYLVVKTILGYSGHECYPGNWYMYYDKPSRKFFPALSREPNLMGLNDEKDLLTNLIYYNHPVEDRSSVKLNFYSIVFSNPSFYMRFRSALKQTILKDKEELIKEWWAAKAYHENLVKGSSLLSLLNVDMKLKDIENNIVILEKLNNEDD